MHVGRSPQLHIFDPEILRGVFLVRGTAQLNGKGEVGGQ
jgi:hypothetical protein